MKDSGPHTVEFVGPWQEHHALVVDGYKMPHVKIFPSKGAQDGMSMLLLDDRFMLEAPDEEIKRWASILFNAMAIGAGFSCYGLNSVVRNDYSAKLTPL